MNFSKRKVALALGFGVGGGMLVASAGALAQGAPGTANPAGQVAQADIKVEVTGSNIKRVEGEGALPVTVMTRADIARTGATTPMELLQTISANSSLGATSFGNVIGAVTFSQQTASLRGLGPSRTLVLVNGKRVVGVAGAVQGLDSGVDLSLIPLAAVERVEVLKDGASAIYGSDAIGGVINFIMRQDYTGIEGEAYYGTPTRSGGGSQYILSGTAGFGDLDKDRYNAFLSLSYNEQRPLDQNDRNFSNTSINLPIGLFGGSGSTFPGFISTGGIGNLNYPDNCGPAHFSVPPEFVGLLGARCYYDPSQTDGVEMIPETKLWNFFGQARFQINKDWQAYVNGLYTRQETTYVIQPPPISDAPPTIVTAPDGSTFPVQFLLPPTSPFYPHAAAQAAGVDGQPLNVRFRCFVCGNRSTTDTTEGGQVVAGVKGSWMNWDWDGSLRYAQSTLKEKVNNGFIQYTKFLPIINSGVFNPFGANTPDVLSQIDATEFRGQTIEGKSKNYGVEGKGSGEIWQLPAGPLSLAIGGEAHRETLDQTPASILATNDVSGYGGNFLPISASRSVWAAYAELNVPIVKSLEADVAVRYEHYSDFGSTTNPKVSLRWQPTPQFLMRASYGTGFVAPSLYQLYDPQTLGLTQTGLSDPIRCPVTNAGGQDCFAQFQTIFGGNPNLKPETAEEMTAGIVLEPISGLSLSLDYFKIRLSNAITNGIPATTILTNPQYYNLIQRSPPDAQFPNLPGVISGIPQTYINLGNEHIQGLDIDLRYTTPVSSIGRFRFQATGTYYIQYDAQNTDGSYTGGVGTAYGAVNTGIIPRYKQYTSVTWDKGPWSATLANTYQTSYRDWGTDLNGNFRTVGSMSLWDLQGSYTGFRNLTLTLGVKNLFDTNPPVTNQQNTFQLGFDPSYYDPRSRFVYGSVRYAFR
jgi:iron complex outermembrane receptor protein